MHALLLLQSANKLNYVKSLLKQLCSAVLTLPLRLTCIDFIDFTKKALNLPSLCSERDVSMLKDAGWLLSRVRTREKHDIPTTAPAINITHGVGRKFLIIYKTKNASTFSNVIFLQ
jgi:hypothetical protein